MQLLYISWWLYSKRTHHTKYYYNAKLSNGVKLEKSNQEGSANNQAYGNFSQ